MIQVRWMAFLMVLMSAPVWAQEVKKLEPVVVTATKLETPQEQLGAAVTVITEQDFKTYHYETVADALRQVPGVQIQRFGSLGKETDLTMRGSSTKQIQVLIDGVRVKSPTDGTFDFSNLSTDQIERIEIVRGPQATLYGADAIGGVINIITKRGRGPLSGMVGAEGGNFGTHREQFSMEGSYKAFDYALSGSALDSAGQFKNDASDQRAITTRLGLALPADGRLSLSIRHNRTATDLPVRQPTPEPPFFILDPDRLQRQRAEVTTLSLQWDQKPFAWYELKARLGQLYRHLSFDDPDNDFTSFRTNDQRREVELVNHFHAGKWNTLSVGFEHRNETGRSFQVDTSFVRSTFFKEINTISGFVQDELRLFDRLFLTGGRRDDGNDVFGRSTTHRASAVLLVKEVGTKLRSSWGEGFRAPTVLDLAFPGFSSPNLKPEKSESWDAGFEQKLWERRIRLGFTYFENKFRDLVQTVFVGSEGFPVNVGRARTDGLEFSLELDLLGNLLLTGNYTFTESKNLDTRQPLESVVPHRTNVGVTWNPIRPVSLFVQAYVVTGHFVSEGFPRNPGYHRIDAGGTYRLADKQGAFPGLELTLRVQNLTDERYMEVFGFRALGINALVGLQARY